jgi:hypothetical protein
LIVLSNDRILCCNQSTNRTQKTSDPEFSLSLFLSLSVYLLSSSSTRNARALFPPTK